MEGKNSSTAKLHGKHRMERKEITFKVRNSVLEVFVTVSPGNVAHHGVLFYEIFRLFPCVSVAEFFLG